jgi:hypothetical protein
MLELNDFMFKNDFDSLTDLQLQKALQIINAEFSGVYTLWSFLPPDVARAKRELCINYLVAWKLVQMYPDSSLNVSGTGSLPLSSKKAGPIFLKYKDMVRQEESILSMLTTNQYGIEALTMIQSAPEMYMVFA